MRTFLLLFVLFVLIIPISTAQEYVRQELVNSYNSLEIFNQKKGVRHLFNSFETAVMDNTDLENHQHASFNMFYKFGQSKMYYHSKDSVEVLLTDLLFEDVLGNGFVMYHYNGIDNYKYADIPIRIEDVCKLNQERYIVHSDSKYYLYNLTSGNYSLINSSPEIPIGSLFRKSESMFYVLNNAGVFRLVYDKNNNSLNSTPIGEEGSILAKPIAKQNNIGFITENMFHILDVNTDEMIPWVAVNSSDVQNFFFTGNALYVLYRNENSILKYTQTEAAVEVFSNENLNTDVELNLTTIFVENDSITLGGSSKRTQSPIVIKIKEETKVDYERPQLEISQATCDITFWGKTWEPSTEVTYDCKYRVTNTGNIPVSSFSVYGLPTGAFGLYPYFYSHKELVPIEPGASVQINFEGKTNFDLKLLHFAIEVADHVLLQSFVYEKVDRIVSTDATQADKYTLYPNPATNQVFVQGVPPSAPYKMFDTNGIIVQAGRLQDSMCTMDGLIPGTYTIQVKTKEDQVLLKLIKQ